MNLLCPLPSRRPGHCSQKRSRLASISPWSCCRRCVSPRQNACPSHAQHRVRSVHAILFHQSRIICLAAGAVDWIARDQRVSCPEDGDENRRRLSARSIALHEGQGSELHHTAHGYGPYLWNDFLFVWPAKRDRKSTRLNSSHLVIS